MSVSYSRFNGGCASGSVPLLPTVANPTPPAAVNAELNAIATALTDTTTHSQEIGIQRRRRYSVMPLAPPILPI